MLTHFPVMPSFHIFSCDQNRYKKLWENWHPISFCHRFCRVVACGERRKKLAKCETKNLPGLLRRWSVANCRMPSNYLKYWTLLVMAISWHVFWVFFSAIFLIYCAYFWLFLVTPNIWNQLENINCMFLVSQFRCENEVLIKIVMKSWYIQSLVFNFLDKRSPSNTAAEIAKIVMTVW